MKKKTKLIGSTRQKNVSAASRLREELLELMVIREQKGDDHVVYSKKTGQAMKVIDRINTVAFQLKKILTKYPDLAESVNVQEEIAK